MTTALHWPALAVCVTSPGQVIMHPAPDVLLTVTVKLQETILLDESVAEQLTGLVPTLKLAPDGGKHVVFTQLPVVVGAG